MKIPISTFDDSSIRDCEIKIITQLKTNSLIVVRIGTMSDSNSELSYSHYEFFKMLFVAWCEIATVGHGIIGFYLDENAELKSIGIGELPGDYYLNDNFESKILDYDSYKELCELMNERPLTLVKFTNERKGRTIVNTILMVNGSEINSTQQINNESNIWKIEK